MRVAPEILAVLSRAETNGKALKLGNQLDRATYQRTNKILEAAGGKWDRRAQAHLFADDAAARVDQILLTGEVAGAKDEFNFFASPPAVVERVMALAGVHAGMAVLEPQAGRGHLAFACADAGARVDCYELMAENAAFLSASGRLHSVQHVDFLTVAPEPIYHAVVMNPPFAKQADIKHVQHALRFLQPQGQLTSVMSASVTYRDNRLAQDFRELVRCRGGEIEALPEGSFKPSGTMAQTVIVTIPGGR